MLRLLALERYRNSDMDSIVQEIRHDTNVGTVFCELLALDTCSNSEVAGILKVIRDVLAKVTERDNVLDSAFEMLADKILGMKFAKSDKDVEIVLLVYFEIILLLKELKVKVSGEDVFYKFYSACIDNYIRKSVREMIYTLFEKAMMDMRFLSLFVSERCYVKFPFLHEFVSKFGCFLENEQAMELCFYLVDNGEVHLASMLIAFSKSTYILNYCLSTVNELSFLRQTPVFANVAFLYQNIDRHFLLESRVSSRYFCHNYGPVLIKHAIDFFSACRDEKSTCVFCAEKRDFKKLQNALEDINNLGRLESCDSLTFRFLRYSRKTNLVNLGHFLSNEKNSGAMKTFLGTFDFSSLTPLEALRLFLGSFVLPGESQIIYRIIEMFNEKYCRDQSVLDQYFEHYAKADWFSDALSSSNQRKMHAERAKSTDSAREMDSRMRHIVEDLPPYTEDISRYAEEGAHRRESEHAGTGKGENTVDSMCIFSEQDASLKCEDSLVQECNDNQSVPSSLLKEKSGSNSQKDAMFVFIYALVALNTQLHNPAAHIRPTFSQFSASLKPQELSSELLRDSYTSIKDMPLRYAKYNEFSVEHYRIFCSLCADLQLPVKYETRMCKSCFAEAYKEIILRSYTQLPGNSASLLCELCTMLGLDEVVYNVVLRLGEDVLETQGLDKRKIMLFFEVFAKHCNAIGDIVPRCEKGPFSSNAIIEKGMKAQGEQKESSGTENTLKAGTNLLAFPFLVFNRILDFKTSEKYTIMKVIRGSSYKKVLLNYESIYLGFIKSTEKLSDSNFVKMVRCTKDSRLRSPFVLDIFFDITLQNCHRVNLSDISAFGEENLAVLAERSIELGLKECFKFITQFMCTENLFGFLESSLKENREFYSSEMVSFVLGFAEKIQDMASFNLVIALQAIQDMFDFVVSISSSEIVCTFSYGDDNSAFGENVAENRDQPQLPFSENCSCTNAASNLENNDSCVCTVKKHGMQDTDICSDAQHLPCSVESQKMDFHCQENDNGAKMENEDIESAHSDKLHTVSLNADELHGNRGDRLLKRRDVFMAYSIDEKFKDILNQKANFLKFVMSSPSIINTNILSRFFRKRNGICIMDSEISQNIDNKLIYLFMKADIFGDKEVLKYSLWIFNLCSASLPLISGFLERNFGLLLQIRSKTLLLSISKILVSRMKKVIDGEPVCMENCKHRDTMRSSMGIIKTMCDYDVADSLIFSSLGDALKKYRTSTPDVFDI